MLNILAGPDAEEQDEADGAEPEHFEAGPHADQDDEVEPAGASGIEQGGAPVGDAEVRDGEQHGGDAPLQAPPGANQVGDDVAGHVTAQEITDVDTRGEQQADHERSPSHSAA